MTRWLPTDGTNETPVVSVPNNEIKGTMQGTYKRWKDGSMDKLWQPSQPHSHIHIVTEAMY